jgi:SAM-dependent methyltransferase
MADHRKVNDAYWTDRVAAHAASPEYGLARFADDPQYLSEVVAFDRLRLGDVRGLLAVHLQCHIGTDTVSLARLGARVTGLDRSGKALDCARALAATAGVEATFVQSDLYGAVDALGEQRFDLVYTGIGALNWLPNIRRWGQVVAALLRPGGRLHMREAHPVLWSLGDVRDDGLLALEFSYFEHTEPRICESSGTYVSTEQVFTNNVTHEWNHGLGEIVMALLDAGMELTLLEEHASVPWNPLPGQMVEVGGGEMQLADRPERLPASYTLQARRIP